MTALEDIEKAHADGSLARRYAALLSHPSAPTAGEMAAAASWLLDDVCARRQLDADQVKVLLAGWLIEVGLHRPTGRKIDLAGWVMDTHGALAIEGLKVIGGQS